MPEPVPFSICPFSYTTLLFSPDGSKCFLGRLKSLCLYCLLINQNPKCLFSLSGCYAGKERFCLFLSFQNCPVVIIAVRLFFRPVFRVKRNGQRDLRLIFLYKNPELFLPENILCIRQSGRQPAPALKCKIFVKGFRKTSYRFPKAFWSLVILFYKAALPQVFSTRFTA